MMIKKVRKKSVEVEAVQYLIHNADEIYDWSGGQIRPTLDPLDQSDCLLIETLEGYMRVERGDYIIKDTWNDFHPIKEDIFEDIYEVVK